MRLLEIDPRRKRRARLALYGGLAALVLLLVALSWLLGRRAVGVGEDTVDPEQYRDDPDVRMLQEYVRIDTTPTTGSELAGARFLAERLEAEGIAATVERLGERQANLWAVVEGREPEALVLHSHIDVFPVEQPERWTVDPFAGEIREAWIYGRGVFDMKSVTVAQLRALLELKRSGRQPRRSVILLATGSEEVGSELGTRWILAHHPELAERFWAVLTEGGIVEPKSRTEVKYWGIEFAQKRFAGGWACADSREVLEKLREEILAWGGEAQEWRLGDEVRTFLERYAETRDRSYLRRILSPPFPALHDPADFRKLPPYLQSMFRDELIPFGVEEDPQGGYRLRLIFHLLPGSELEAARRRLLPPWIAHHVSLTLEPALGASGGSPLEHPAFLELAAAIRERHPGAEPGPYFLPWSATDSRFFRQAGVPSFGFSPFVIFATDTYRVDAVNERIGLPGFVGGVRLYGDVVRRLAG